MVDRPAPEIKGIEVTPEMIEAGAVLLCGFQTVTKDEADWAEEVFYAMLNELDNS